MSVYVHEVGREREREREIGWVYSLVYMYAHTYTHTHIYETSIYTRAQLVAVRDRAFSRT